MEVTVNINYKNEKLQGLRRAAGISQTQMAKEAGVNLRVYQYYEQGVKDISKAQLPTLLKICNVLGCRIADIITDQETVELLKKYER